MTAGAFESNGTAVTADPDPGYHFVDWSDGNTSNPRTDTNVTADKSVTANFAINTYNLTYATDAGGTITGDTHQSVAHGADGSAVTAIPAAGYTFLKWSDGVTTPSRTDTAVQSDLAVTATFQAIATYTITSSAGSNGSISPLGDRNLPAGGSQTYAVTPNVGYHIADVVVDGVSRGRDRHLHLQQRDGTAHDRRDVRHQHLHDHTASRPATAPSRHLPNRPSATEATERSRSSLKKGLRDCERPR